MLLNAASFFYFASPDRNVFFRAFYEPSDHGFFIMTAPRIYKLYKNDCHYQVIGIGKHSENLEDMFICKASYTPSISPKGKFGADRTKYGKKQKDGKSRL